MVYLFLNGKNFKCGLFQRINREIRHNLSQNRGILNTAAENIAATKTWSETGRNGDGKGEERDGNGLLKNTSLIIRRISVCAVKKGRIRSKKEAAKKKRKNCDLRFSISTLPSASVCASPVFNGSLNHKNHRQCAKGLIDYFFKKVKIDKNYFFQ